VLVTLELDAAPAGAARDIAIGWKLRDADDSVTAAKRAVVKPGDQPTRHAIDVTPDPAAGTGPFTVELATEGEASAIDFSADFRFASANATVPFAGFEDADPSLWFAADGNPASYRSLEYYYSNHLRDLLPRDNPLVVFDETEKHSGRRALRLDYRTAGEAHAWSLVNLPGKPLAMTVWVKGNGSADRLLVHFEDNSNFTLPAWQRNANFSTASVCTLEHTDWRPFRVPVLGEGLQVVSSKGSTEKVDVPVRILAFTVRPAPLPKGAPPAPPSRSVWIDDFSAETQVPASQQMSLELRSSDARSRLTPDGSVTVAVGNGFDRPLAGKVTATVRDGAGAPLWTASVALPVRAGETAVADIPLAALAAKLPRGPVEVELLYADPAIAGARVTGRLTLSAPAHGGIVHDFEEPIEFSGYQPGKATPGTATVVAGGADGKGHALSLPVVEGAEFSSVLFHPALPGVTQGVELMVRGGSRPVVLQPWFIDSGATGIWLRPYNLFWADPVTVDWQGWRKVVIPAPPPPPFLTDKNRYFLLRPFYPLNFAIGARVQPSTEAAAEKAPVEIRFDDLAVRTHLEDDAQVEAAIAYADATRLHAPGSALELSVFNWSAQPRKFKLKFALRSYQGTLAREGTVDLSVGAGAKGKAVLVSALVPGIYDLTVEGAGKEPLAGPVLVVDRADWFGEDPIDVLSNPLLLRRMLGLTHEKVYLDWDNTEPAAYLRHWNWFEQELKKANAIQKLPRKLEAPTQRFELAKAARDAADKAHKAATNKAAAAAKQEKPAVEKLAKSQAALDAAAKDLDDASTQSDMSIVKRDAALKEAVDAKARADAAGKAVAKLDSELKSARGKLAPAEKTLREAEAAHKDAAAKAATAKTAADTAQRDAEKAEAAAQVLEPKPAPKVEPKKDEPKKEAPKKVEPKKVEDKPDPKLIEVRAKAKAARSAADAAVAKLVAANKTVDDRATALDKAKTALAALKTDVDKLTADQAKAAKAADAATKASTTAGKAADPLKADATKAGQRLAQAKQKHTQAKNSADNDRKTLDDRKAAIAAANAEVDAAEKDLAAAIAKFDSENRAYETAKAEYAFTLLPIVGFSAEWAGPEAVDAMTKGVYTRWIPNVLQVPRRGVDWSLFLREVMREHRGRFASWVFWENPDLDDSPQGIPPARYGPMLETFARWVRLYDPKSKVVAGGFNFAKALPYLRRLSDAHKLPFDEIAVQVNVGELSPEHADLEGWLDDLNDLLRIRQTNRLVRITELDWPIGKYLPPLQQAAHHARAALILDSRGVPEHRFSLLNSGFEFAGYGVFHRIPYGNTAELQTFEPLHVPKPSYFALAGARRVLRDWKFVASAEPPDRGLSDNRAYIYRNASGDLAVAVWRAVAGDRTYRVPASWNGSTAADIFGYPLSIQAGLRCTPLPSVIKLPKGVGVSQLLFDLRTLQPADGSYPVLADIHPAEPDSAQRAAWTAQGSPKATVRSGAIPGDRKIREEFVEGLTGAGFEFDAPAAGAVLMNLRTWFDGKGGKVFVKLNDAAEGTWDLSAGQGNDPGPRELSYVLANAKPGRNRVSLRFEPAASVGGVRIEPMPADHVPLARWGILNTRQTRGEVLRHASATGTPLSVGKTAFTDGLGCHAVSFLEYPVDERFAAFEVAVGIDGATEGRGSAVFRIFVDGKEKANSGIVTGFHAAKTLRVELPPGTKRLILAVGDADDGNRDDLADWLDGKFLLKK